MNFSIQSAKTIEEALELALQELKTSPDAVDVEILQEPSGGFFGLIGGKDAIVKVRKKIDNKEILNSILKDEEMDKVMRDLKEKDEVSEEAKEAEVVSSEVVSSADEVLTLENDVEEESFVEETDEELEYLVREFIDKVMSALGVGYTLSVDFNDRQIDVTIDGKREETGIVIGKRGLTLNGIQTVLSTLVNQRTKEFRRVIVDCSGYRKKREIVLKRIAGRTANKVLKTNKSIKLEPMNAQERRIIHACLANVEGIRTKSEGKDPHRCVVIHKELA